MNKSNFLGKIKGLNIAIIVMAALSILLSAFLVFGTSLLFGVINDNGGFSNMASLMNTSNVVNQTGVSESIAQNSNEFATDPNSDMAQMSSYEDLFSAAFIFIAVLFVFMLLFSIANLVFSILIIIKRKRVEKFNFCVTLGIWNIVFSVLSINWVNIVLTIISLVFSVKQKKLNAQMLSDQ